MVDKAILAEYKAEETNLRETHELFEKYFDEWIFLNAAYEGVSALIAAGALIQHERESDKNYERRMKTAYGFDYSKSVVDIFNSYLFKKEFPDKIPERLSKDEQWKQFQKNCDYEENTFDEFMINEQKNASILGHVGLLVDKPAKDAINKKQEKEEGIYPYVVAYKPMAILDWQYERDELGRMVLTYLKVLDDDDYYRIWTREIWEVWEIVAARSVEATKAGAIELRTIGEQDTKAEVKGDAQTARKIAEGVNPLGEIPFVWLYNQRSGIDKQIGSSDIADVSRVDASIIRNLSQIEEIVDYAAFPMMRKPKPESVDEKDEVGPTAILEFDPDNAEGTKADWLAAEVAQPVQAVISVIGMKVGEIYRSSNIGGMSATEISTSAKSGVALRTEFQLLNSKLIKKAKNVAKAKMGVARYWLMWNGEYEKYKEELHYGYPTGFELEDLAADLENALTATVVVTQSETFKKEIQKSVVRWMLPLADEKTLAEIDKEIDAGTYMGLQDFFSKNGGFGEEEEKQGENNQPPPVEGTQAGQIEKLKAVK